MRNFFPHPSAKTAKWPRPRFWIARVLAVAVGFACTLATMSLGWQVLTRGMHGCRLDPHQGTRLRLAQVRHAADRFILDHDRCPWNVEELATTGERPTSMKDAWREEILLVCIPTDAGHTAVALSSGPDRRFGTDDDLRSDPPAN